MSPLTRGVCFGEVVPICIGTILTISNEPLKRGLFLGGRPDLYQDHPDDLQRALIKRGVCLFGEVVLICIRTIPTIYNEPL